MADRLLDYEEDDPKLEGLIQLLAVNDVAHSAWGEFPEAVPNDSIRIAWPPRFQ